MAVSPLRRPIPDSTAESPVADADLPEPSDNPMRQHRRCARTTRRRQTADEWRLRRHDSNEPPRRDGGGKNAWSRFTPAILKPLSWNLETAVSLPHSICLCLVSAWAVAGGRSRRTDRRTNRRSPPRQDNIQRPEPGSANALRQASRFARGEAQCPIEDFERASQRGRAGVRPSGRSSARGNGQRTRTRARWSTCCGTSWPTWIGGTIGATWRNRSFRPRCFFIRPSGGFPQSFPWSGRSLVTITSSKRADGRAPMRSRWPMSPAA